MPRAAALRPVVTDEPTGASLYEELLSLARQSGPHRVALQQRRLLRSLPVVQQIVGSSDRDLRSVISDLLEAGVRRLLDTPSSSPGISLGELAAASLGLVDWRGVSGLTNRLKAFGESKGRSYSLIRLRYPDSIAALALLLPELGVDEVVAGATEDEKSVESQQIILRSEVRHVIVGRIPRRTIIDQTSLVRNGPVSLLVTAGHYPNDPRQGSFKVIPISNCYIRGKRASGIGLHRWELAVPKTLNGGRVRLCYEIEVMSHEPDKPYLRHHVETPVKSVSVGVQFERGDYPARVWAFGNEAALHDPLARSPRAKIVPLNSVGYVEHEFGPQMVGQSYGLAWDWTSA